KREYEKKGEYYPYEKVKGEVKINDSGRREILKISMRAFLDKPLIGWGPDTLSERLSTDYPKEYEEHLDYHNSFIDKAHNEFLEYAVSNGIFNLIAYLSLISITIYNLWRDIKEVKIKVLFLTLIGYLVQSFFNISVIMVAPIFWIFLGYCNSTKE
ncbi:MAG: O-antigen ligase family protein, partial [Clostridium sp.]|uniref:O-antigen ligase family protein n=1 Tax=Clostridium sp. TaxID=1506 RepID=UPI0029074682